VPTAPARRFARDELREGPGPRDTPPPELAAQLEALGKALDEQLPRKQLDHNLLIATWNLREFGRVCPKWEAAADDVPKRDVFSVRVIAEIVSRFDVVALQEIQTDIEALRMLVRALGPHWGLILTDAVKSEAGDNERLAFVYDTRRAIPSGLACELVVPDEVLAQGVGEDALKTQFAKTPYAVAFRSEGNTFILVTLHVKYGNAAKERKPELAAIAQWMRDWADDTKDEFNQNLIALGDFNIDKADDELHKAFMSRGLHTPPQLLEKSRTLPTKDGKRKFYDQIAWFTDGDEAKLALECIGASNFEWDPYVFPDLTRSQKSFRISDHYPLWCEFQLPPRG
jgi:endonuclease/exonuclease/phosphatase family metal-dependent hydrolase